ncbi:MAG TPA: hypothetical protein VNO17_08405 [Actinomycetota bacterium]|nr:hypothetical protein [Actinomycetota bacterium]
MRFRVPLYTVREAAWLLGVPAETLRYWTGGRRSIPPLVTTRSGGPRGHPALPFIGLAEAFVVVAFRRSTRFRISLQYIRRALAAVEADIGVEHALASRRLYTDGARLLVEHGKDDAGAARLAEAVTRNLVFTGAVESYLRRITFADDGWATRLVLPGTKGDVVQVDPHRASGQPLTIRGGARIVDIIDRFRGGETPDLIARDFEVPVEDVLEIIRAFYSPLPEAA